MFSLILAYLLMATIADGIVSTTELVLTPLGTSLSSGIKRAELVARHTKSNPESTVDHPELPSAVLTAGLSALCALMVSVGLKQQPVISAALALMLL